MERTEYRFLQFSLIGTLGYEIVEGLLMAGIMMGRPDNANSDHDITTGDAREYVLLAGLKVVSKVSQWFVFHLFTTLRMDFGTSKDKKFAAGLLMSMVVYNILGGFGSIIPHTAMRDADPEMATMASAMAGPLCLEVTRSFAIAFRFGSAVFLARWRKMLLRTAKRDDSVSECPVNDSESNRNSDPSSSESISESVTGTAVQSDSDTASNLWSDSAESQSGSDFKLESTRTRTRTWNSDSDTAPGRASRNGSSHWHCQWHHTRSTRRPDSNIGLEVTDSEAWTRMTRMTQARMIQVCRPGGITDEYE